MLEYKASLHIKNRQNLTPLTLAAKLARKEVIHLFSYIKPKTLPITNNFKIDV